MKKSKRKSTKPVALLTKIEALLSDVLNELSSIEKSVERNVRELLLSAETSIARAKKFIAPALAFEAPRAAGRRKARRAGRTLRPRAKRGVARKMRSR